MKHLRFETPLCELEVIDEGMYAPWSVDKLRQYSREYLLFDVKEYASQLGIVAVTKDGSQHSCIVMAQGWTVSVHEHSAAIISDRIFIAVGNRICCLLLPSLELRWHREVDFATCFGVYFSRENNCLISHGECDIARFSLNGELVWSVSGKDIFSGDLSLFIKHVDVTDFNLERYRISISDGNIQLVDGKR